MTYPNGHKEHLEELADRPRPSTAVTIAHAALYLGRILEMIAWTLGREVATRPDPPEWWDEWHPCPENMPEA